MYKKLKIVMLVCFASALTASAQVQKIGYVNQQFLLDTLPGKDTVLQNLEVIQKRLYQRLTDKETELSILQKELNELMKDSANQSFKISLKKEGIKKLQKDYINDQQSIEQEWQYYQQMAMQPRVLKIKELIASTAKARGFTQILDIAAVAWLLNQSDDITGDVVKAMYRSAPKLGAIK